VNLVSKKLEVLTISPDQDWTTFMFLDFLAQLPNNFTVLLSRMKIMGNQRKLRYCRTATIFLSGIYTNTVQSSIPCCTFGPPTANRST